MSDASYIQPGDFNQPDILYGPNQPLLPSLSDLAQAMSGITGVPLNAIAQWLFQQQQPPPVSNAPWVGHSYQEWQAPGPRLDRDPRAVGEPGGYTDPQMQDLHDLFHQRVEQNEVAPPPPPGGVYLWYNAPEI